MLNKNKEIYYIICYLFSIIWIERDELDNKKIFNQKNFLTQIELIKVRYIFKKWKC